MTEVLLFGEDHGHEVIVGALARRLANEAHVPIEVRTRSATGGHGRMLSELRQFVSELGRGQAALPDLLIVARDANCRGRAACLEEVQQVVAEYRSQTIVAAPDPHIERWCLLDSQAFKQVLGEGCQTPDDKCDRHRYKKLLADAVRAAGVQPLLGGIEHAADIIGAMNLARAELADSSFVALARELRAAFHRLKLR
jgi:hypothetical protein